MQYEIIFKVLGVVHVILAFIVLLLLLKLLRRWLLVLVLGLLMDQRLLTNTWPKQCTEISIQANTNKKLRNSTSLHKNSALNYSNTVLRVTTIAWI